MKTFKAVYKGYRDGWVNSVRLEDLIEAENLAEAYEKAKENAGKNRWDLLVVEAVPEKAKGEVK